MVRTGPERAAAAQSQARAAAGDYNAYVAANRNFRPPDFVRGKLGEAVMGRIFSPRGSVRDGGLTVVDSIHFGSPSVFLDQTSNLD